MSRRKVIIDGQEVDFTVVQPDATQLNTTSTIPSLPKEGTVQPISVSATAAGATVVLTPSAGKAAKVTAWNLYVDADVICELRFTTSGNVIAGIPTKGINAMNVVGREAPTGGPDETVEVYVSGATNVKGWLCYEEV